jgi:regulator of chromosome condensation
MSNDPQSNDGILGFRENIHTQRSPMLIPELKRIKTMAVGTNHVLALDDRGKTTIWGAGEQGQLARRVVSRTAKGALVPREFGLQRKKIVVLGAGDYHSFAIDDKGNVYSWGLNTFGQTGVPKRQETEENTVGAPTLVASLKGFDIKQIAGGAHHTLACTKDGQVLIWGRMDTSQGGVEIDKMDKDSLFFDEYNKPRFYTKPVVIPDINGEYIATANDTCIAVDKDGKAFSWGFSSNYQTGQGSDQDVTHATHIDNSAVRGKKLVFAGLGGQFGVVAGEVKDEVITNGVH